MLLLENPRNAPCPGIKAFPIKSNVTADMWLNSTKLGEGQKNRKTDLTPDERTTGDEKATECAKSCAEWSGSETDHFICSPHM